MSLSPKQAQTLEDSTARLNIAEGAVRSGKTVGFNYRIIEAIGETGPVPGAHHMMIGKTERTLAANILAPLESYLGKRNFSYSTGQHMARMFGIPIQLFGASDIRSEGKIRGITGAKVLGDEITLWPPGFMSMLDTRLSMEESQFFGTTNPDGPFHELKVNYLDRAEELDLKSFHFAIEDNPFLSEKYLKSLKKNYVGLFKKRFIDGLWVAAEGAIFDFFEEKRPYVIPHADLPEAKSYEAAIDYGTSNPFTCGVYGINPDTTPKIWLEKVYWYNGKEMNRQKTDKEYCEELKDFFGDERPSIIYVDPSAASFKVEMSRQGISGVRDADNDVLNGIMTHSRMLKSGEFAVSDKCKDDMKEYQSYAWDPKAQIKGIDKPLKQMDHGMDRTRYMLHSKYGQDHIDYERFITM